MAYLEELLPEFRKGAKIRQNDWSDGVYIFVRNGEILQSHPSLDVKDDNDLISNKWEFYQDPIDWEYIIDHKCLCWFSDEAIEEPNFADRLLAIVENESGIKFMTEGKVVFACCRPVYKDEVTFYEDKRDGNN